jgi:hypothetical protein
MLATSNTLEPYYKSIQPTTTKKEQLVQKCLDIISRKEEKENKEEKKEEMADLFYEMQPLWNKVVSEPDGEEITTLLIGLAKIVQLYPTSYPLSVSELIASTFSTILFILDIRMN